jgi:hypothetical protein
MLPNRELMDAELRATVEKAKKKQYGQVELKNIKGRFYLYKVTSNMTLKRKKHEKSQANTSAE